MIETERLIILPLNHSQLIKYIRVDNSLESELNLKKSSRKISSELKEALENTILPNVANPDKNYLFSTLWTLISKENNKMVGDMCFVGEPDEDGEVEIGYGTYEEYRNNGYMTEAVGAMINWVSGQPGVKSVYAAVEKNNLASFEILKKNNFTKIGETEEFYHWRFVVI